MSALNEQLILNALKHVVDPDLHRDIVSLGFIKDLEIKNHAVSFKVELTTPACPVKEKMKQQSMDAVLSIPDVETVDITMTSRVSGGNKQELLPNVLNIFAVASGKGGVGKSTTAVNIALALAETGAKVGLLDADIYGPSLPRMLNMVEKPLLEQENNEKIVPVEVYGIKAMSMGFFLEEDTPMVWRGPMVGKAVEQLLGDVEWGHLDYLVVDLPPGTGDAQLSLTQKVHMTGAVIVSTPQDVALADVKKGISMFKTVNVPILGVIENMSFYICSDCGHRAEIFSHGGARREAQKSDIKFLGEIPLDEKIRSDSDAGTPVMISSPTSQQAGYYREIAGSIAAQISIIRHRSDVFPKIVVQ
ncbi:MAG: iron-sulfur cluster carrier protein ApbC [Magnetococcales bacterium]|nr:iron-sulfur cluster carrier protein ApbC [Magnetococcales bacterium]